MKRYQAQAFLFLLVLAAAMTLACGSSASRTLQSVTISPASADAQNFPGGLVQFTATGIYAAPPSPVAPLAATWGACDQSGNVTSAVSVSSSGVAQCKSGAAGTYQVWAFDLVTPPGGAECLAETVCGGGCGRVTGTAQLICP
ncbi:MAG: hypothetical protein ACLPHP_00980 [Candidatus Sulfotelmatobacter sp.]